MYIVTPNYTLPNLLVKSTTQEKMYSHYYALSSYMLTPHLQVYAIITMA